MPTGIFAAGYLAVWGVFSLAATAAQWGLERTGLLRPEMNAANVPFAASLLVTAGLYQVTPLKKACLRHCRGPIQFITAYWRPGRGGAFQMGVRHGAFCVGCCWFLMGLLFFGGVMNLYWIAGLAGLVLLEKVTPPGNGLPYLIGAGLVVWGVYIAVM